MKSETTLRIINVAPLFLEHKDEVTQDLLRIQKDCGVTDIAFMMPLHPEESHPTQAKARHLSALFGAMRDSLEGSGLRIGILIQSTMGHGVVTDAKFQRTVISRMLGYEPGSGDAYREMLSANIGSYRTLRNLIPHVKWQGPTVPFCSEISERPARNNPVINDNWSVSVMGHLGIPCHTGSSAGSELFMLTGGEIPTFSDDELKSFLSKGVLLDGSAAEALTARGLASLTGVEADSPNDWKADLEMVNDDDINGKACNREFIIAALAPGLAFRLKPVEGAKVRILSTLCSQSYYSNPEKNEVGPGLVLFENSLGGRVATFACKTGFTAFLHETRREQLLGVLGWLNRIPLAVTVESDIDIYAMHGTLKIDDSDLLCLFNLNLDSLPDIKLRFGGKLPASIQALKADGNWATLKWNEAADSLATVDTPLESVTPLILRIVRKA